MIYFFKISIKQTRDEKYPDYDYSIESLIHG